MFSIQEVNEIIKLLQDSQWLFIAKNINSELLPKDIISDLISKGFDLNTINKFPQLAFQFGMLSVYLGENKSKQINFETLKKMIKVNKIKPLSQEEKFAVEIVEHRAVEGITGLGNKMSSNLRTVIIEGDLKKRKDYERLIKDKAKEAIINRESKKWLASQIGEISKDWARDLDRISDFVLHEAYDNGRAYSIKKKYGEDSKVYKRVHENACKHCKRLYLRKKDSKEPIIFNLMDLLNNGININVKVKDWKPVIGATHPWCRCDLEYLIPGYAWDNNLEEFTLRLNSKNTRKFDFKIKKEIS
jgi:hypothetical protein